MNKKVLGQSIEERPQVVEGRQKLGHWEGDLVKAKRVDSEPALMTLTERVSRLEIIVKLPNYHASTCRRALQNTIGAEVVIAKQSDLRRLWCTCKRQL